MKNGAPLAGELTCTVKLWVANKPTKVLHTHGDAVGARLRCRGGPLNDTAGRIDCHAAWRHIKRIRENVTGVGIGGVHVINVQLTDRSGRYRSTYDAGRAISRRGGIYLHRETLDGKQTCGVAWHGRSRCWRRFARWSASIESLP